MEVTLYSYNKNKKSNINKTKKVKELAKKQRTRLITDENLELPKKAKIRQKKLRN